MIPREYLEPIDGLMVQALDSESEPMRDDPDDTEQRYGSTVIGYALDNCEGASSIAQIVTGDGREFDEAVARTFVEAVKKMFSPSASEQPANAAQQCHAAGAKATLPKCNDCLRHDLCRDQGVQRDSWVCRGRATSA